MLGLGFVLSFGYWCTDFLVVQRALAAEDDAGDNHYLWMGRIVTVVGILLSVGTAYIASSFTSIMDYVQAFFSIFNAPLLATFLLGMFWKRTTPWGGFVGLVVGTVVSIALWICEQYMHLFSLGSSEGSSMWRAFIAWVVCFATTIIVSFFTARKKDEELRDSRIITHPE